MDADAIRDALEQQVVGQRSATADLALLLAMHLSRTDGTRAPNGIVLGPTGCGKTHLLRTAASALGLPFVSQDATSLVPSGIVGDQTEDLMESLVREADAAIAASRRPRRRHDDIELAQRGILFIDEFDKLAAPVDASPGSHADRRVIQRRLLKLAEGARLRVGVKYHADAGRDRFIDTGGMLLLVGGVFAPLTDDLEHGFGTLAGRRPVESLDIASMGFLPELMGRLPVLIRLDALAPGDLVGILEHEHVSPLATWRSYLATAYGAELVIEEAAKWVIAERAAELGMGARGLTQVLFPALSERVAQLPRSETANTLVLRAADVMTQPLSRPAGSAVH